MGDCENSIAGGTALGSPPRDRWAGPTASRRGKEARACDEVNLAGVLAGQRKGRAGEAAEIERCRGPGRRPAGAERAAVRQHRRQYRH